MSTVASGRPSSSPTDLPMLRHVTSETMRSTIPRPADGVGCADLAEAAGRLPLCRPCAPRASYERRFPPRGLHVSRPL